MIRRIAANNHVTGSLLYKNATILLLCEYFCRFLIFLSELFVQADYWLSKQIFQGIKIKISTREIEV